MIAANPQKVEVVELRQRTTTVAIDGRRHLSMVVQAAMADAKIEGTFDQESMVIRFADSDRIISVSIGATWAAWMAVSFVEDMPWNMPDGVSAGLMSLTARVMLLESKSFKANHSPV